MIELRPSRQPTTSKEIEITRAFMSAVGNSNEVFGNVPDNGKKLFKYLVNDKLQTWFFYEHVNCLIEETKKLLGQLIVDRVKNILAFKKDNVLYLFHKCGVHAQIKCKCSHYEHPKNWIKGKVNMNMINPINSGAMWTEVLQAFFDAEDMAKEHRLVTVRDGMYLYSFIQSLPTPMLYRKGRYSL